MNTKQPLSTFLGIAAAVVLAANSHAADIFVNGTCGNDAWSGLSDVCVAPDGPKATIQAGINAAVNGDVVIVAQGEYFENIDFDGKAITVRSTDPNDAGVVLNTIINGGGIFPTTVVTCTSGEGSDTVLSGFVITGGNATNGGGMHNNDSSPTVTNCSFSGNTGGTGGGMNNTSSNPTVTNCSFSGNTATNNGGGMYNNNSSPTVTNCSFSGNTAANGGGMFNTLSSSPTVTNCAFSGNTATSSGGGMFNGCSSPTVSNCTFNGNTANNGGGMANCVSNPTVTNCTFSGNSAGFGGGMVTFGPIFPTLSNTGFCDNTPDQAPGVFIDGGGNSLLYCPPPIPIPDPCPTDINGDGVTNVLDLIDLLLAFGTACP